MRPTQEEIDRFLSKVDKKSENECWLWIGGTKNKEGYGGFWINELQNTVNCHKLMFIIVHNFDWEDIPDSIVIRHSCNNPPCCNPKHLKLGTFKDNSQDMVKAGNSLKGVKNPKYKHLDKQFVKDVRDDFINGKSPSQIAKERGLSKFYTLELVKNRVYRDEAYMPPDIDYKIKFDDSIVQEVIDMKRKGCTIQAIKNKFNISQTQIYNYIRGEQRKNVRKS